MNYKPSSNSFVAGDFLGKQILKFRQRGAWLFMCIVVVHVHVYRGRCSARFLSSTFRRLAVQISGIVG